jgi:hypothetical protein
MATLCVLICLSIATSQDQRELVIASADSAQLDRWFDRAITASTAAEVFAD